jgi:hypothetical protein
MDKKQIEIEARLNALEIFAANQLSIYCLTSTPNAVEALRKIKKQLIDGAKQQTFSDRDAVVSDLLSAETESSLALLVEMADEQIAEVLSNRKK